ncbi:hypothetical protein [Parerythrobacter aestuarii]|uniref:hypothetical protein n=1 Tax=Parerythrobacter aestuarii TaxID=3020909 RepID=UPI0024DED760|nr:hypothetical protein [Parerythrobacter aestuarii]
MLSFRIPVIAAVALCAAPLVAQESAPDEEAQATPAIELPDLVAPDGKYGNELKFFVFHKEGVSYDAARSDIAECTVHTVHGRQLKMPAFVAWDDDDRTSVPVEFNGSYGLVGLAIYSIIDGPIERSIRQQVMMRCMLPRGYDRYSVTEEMWKQIHVGDNPTELIDLQAAIAAGPVPATPKVTS